MFESRARASNHVVDIYNFNPSNPWHQLYLKNQQIERAQLSLSSLLSSLGRGTPTPNHHHHQAQHPAGQPMVANRANCSFAGAFQSSSHGSGDHQLRQQIELSKFHNPFL